MSFPTSYIKTEGSQVTRSADNCSRTLGQEFNKDAWTFFLDLPKIAMMSGQRIVNISDGTPSNRLQIEANSDIEYAFNIAVVLGGVTQFVKAERHNGQPKVAICYSNGVFEYSVNGNVTESFSGALPIGLPEIIFGNNNAGSAATNAIYKRSLFIPRALSATELQTLTAPEA